MGLDGTQFSLQEGHTGIIQLWERTPLLMEHMAVADNFNMEVSCLMGKQTEGFNLGANRYLLDCPPVTERLGTPHR